MMRVILRCSGHFSCSVGVASDGCIGSWHDLNHTWGCYGALDGGRGVTNVICGF